MGRLPVLKRISLGLVVLFLSLLAIPLLAEIRTGCDGMGRRVWYSIDDSGRLTIFIRTSDPDPSCTGSS